ncbi:hypothetical protein LOC68_10295 [Blastopirellula sp. JC732]|uniref:Tetratricopeptide repeat protein n=1 Tax=Blastopirellula sediminis TaxID=2894196 RepID=A0A9X1MKS6_9BACT|nr:hypothetical protein [Blastopirellula sediminis]MCC9608435.1 hypothetical protein [Blastopirellula sediminis]MCC9628788.1 hypothetical protein [Blastopirellula sediminis]
MNSPTEETVAPAEIASWSALPPESKKLFQLAAENWDQSEVASQYVERALEESNDMETLVSAYRYYFYKSQPTRALELAEMVLERIRSEQNLPTEWDELEPLLATHQQNLPMRLYLTAYAAKALLMAQLGDYEAAKTIAARVSVLDPRREFCATTVHEVLTNPEE